ncbi:MAG: PAS domain-containing sensor histidine kinase [Pseudomonadota bacterium]
MANEQGTETAADGQRTDDGPAVGNAAAGIGNLFRQSDTNPAPEESPGARMQNSRFWTWAGICVVVLSLLCGAATFAVFTGLTPFAPTRQIVLPILAFNGLLVLALTFLILREAIRLYIARRRGIAGARLHLRIAGLFSVIAALPALLVAVVAMSTLDRGLDRWFSDRTRSIVQTSVSVAQSYLREHGQVIRADILAMAADLNRAKEQISATPERFQAFIDAQTSIRAIPAAYILTEDLTALHQNRGSANRRFLLPPQTALEQASGGEPIIIAPGETNQVGAIMVLENYPGQYLYVARTVDPEVINYLRTTQANAAEFQRFQENRTNVQAAFGLVYFGFALVLLLAAIWIGIAFANRLVAPIGTLIDAADRVAQGRFDFAVPVREDGGDLMRLGKTFNNMTSELRVQRNELLRANTKLDGRRRFTEAVLAGVTAGVIGVGRNGVINVVNRSAMNTLGGGRLVGRHIEEVLPEIRPLIAQAEANPRRIIRKEVGLVRNGQQRTIDMRVSTEFADPSDHSLVVTLDDITDLVNAQRSSAWADIARRIAHEIKNPLTPIQLSAERLRRRYGKKVAEDDTEVFDQCVDTIIRQVGDIGQMVDEFSSFARMPKPAFEIADLAEVVEQTVFLMRVGYPDITFSVELGQKPLMASFDRRLLSQALTNIIKNGTEAVTAVSDAERGGAGTIDVALSLRDGMAVVDVTDNGIGLPAENRERLLEPYMTTREKGTGLGLAIVGRILEEHGGTIRLSDAPAVAEGGRGARVSLQLPVQDDASTQSDEALAKELADALNEMAEAHKSKLETEEAAAGEEQVDASAERTPASAEGAARPESDQNTTQATTINTPAPELERP